MHYYQFNIGDYIKSAGHLTWQEDIAYRRLLDMYYDTELPIPNDIPWVLRKLRLAEFDHSILQTVLDEFFILTENGWINSRADIEIGKFKDYLSKQKSNGIKGGRPKKPTGNPSLTQAEPKITLTNNHKPITNNHKPKYNYTTDDLAVAEIIFDGICRLNPNHKKPNLESWANSIRLMRESDKRNHAEIRELFDWANHHYFWAKNILSPDKLREKFDTLVIQRNQELSRGQYNGQSQQPAIDNSAAGRVRAANQRRRELEARQEQDNGFVGNDVIDVRT